MRRFIGVGLTILTVFVGCAGPHLGRDAPALGDLSRGPRRLPAIVDQAAPLTENLLLTRNHGEANSPPVATAQLVAHQEIVPPRPANLLFDGLTTADELIGYAVANNASIAAARFKAESLYSRILQVRSFDDPLLATTVFLEEVQTAAGPQEVVLSLSQKFPWFGKRYARGEIAYHNARVAYAELADLELAVAEQVSVAYYDLYFIEQAKGVYAQLEPRLEDVIFSTRTRFETDSNVVGLETVLQAEVALHKLQITLAELDQGKQKAEARLAQLLHLPPGVRLDIQTQIAERTPPPDVELLSAMLDQRHPQLAARREAIDRDSWSEELAYKAYFPDVNLGFNWIATGETGLSSVANGDDAFSLMVGVNLPIYRTKRDAAVREAQFKMSQSTRQYEAVWDALRADIEKLHAKIVEHDQVLEILNFDILRKSEQSFELSMEAYRVNRIGFQQLIDTYENWLQFRIKYHFRLASRAQSLARLERALGEAIVDFAPPSGDAPGELPLP